MDIPRDVKPSNVMIAEDRAILMDFGLAKAPGQKGLTRDGIIAGTPEYMSPEQAKAEDLDNRSDIYSLGITMFEMLAGDVPFKGSNAITILRMHCEVDPPDILEYNPALPPVVSSIIANALSKDRAHRFPDATAMAAAMVRVFRTTELEEIAKRSKISDLPETKFVSGSRVEELDESIRGLHKKKKVLKAVFISASAMLISAMLWFFLFQDIVAGKDKRFEPARTTSDEYGRMFVVNPICRIRKADGAEVIGRIIEIKDDGKEVIFNLIDSGRRVTWRGATDGDIEITILTKDERRELGLDFE